MFEPVRSLLPNARFGVTAPGRVNLLGEHVDYNDGWVLPAAIDRAVRLAAAPRADRKVSLRALDLDQSVIFDLDRLDGKVDEHGAALPAWALYPAGVAWVLQKHNLTVDGMDVVFTSNVPIGAGLSSSAAVEVGFTALWRAASGWQLDNMQLAKLAQEAETHYVGVNCGLMDQFASANGVDGHVLCLDTRTLEWQAVPLPAGCAIVIADSGVRRSLTTSAYNERRAACEEAVRLLSPHLPCVTALRDVSPADFEANARDLPEMVRKRARHVVEECARVIKALESLKNGDAEGFGRLMLEGHASLRDLYEVSCPELNALVEIARNLPGCWGARLTGAGFGGCTVNLVAEVQAHDFIASLRAGYQQAMGRTAEVYLCHASQGVSADVW
jgi:galactokinase